MKIIELIALADVLAFMAAHPKIKTAPDYPEQAVSTLALYHAAELKSREDVSFE